MTLDGPGAPVLPCLLALGAAVAAPAGWPRLGALVILALLVGVWRAGAALPRQADGPLSPYRGQVVRLEGAIGAPPRCGPTSCLVLLEIEQLEAGARVERLTARVQVRTRPDPDLAYGRILSARGELHPPRATVGFPRVELLARQGVYEVLDFPSVRLGPPAEAPRASLERVRAALESRLAGLVPGPEGRLAAGLLFGRDVALPPEVRAQLRDTGTSHIVAVSGFNVALIGGAVLGLAGGLATPRVAAAVCVLVVAGYTLLVGAPPSAVRAALMFLATGLAVAVGRLPDQLTALVVAGAVMAVVDPLLLLDPGFQLSFAAMLGLVLLGERLTPGWGRLPRPLASALGFSLAAELFTTPIALHTFHNLALVSPLANVLVGPALPLTMICAAFVLAAGNLPLVGELAGSLAWWTSHYLLVAIGWAAGLPSASVATGSLPLWAVPALYSLIVAPLAVSHVGAKRSWPRAASLSRLAVVLAVVGVPAVLAGASLRPTHAGQVRAVLFDVGGDGLALVETPSGRRVLAGASSSPLAAAALADQLPLLDRALDLLIVARVGERDLDGLAEVVRRYPPRLVLQPERGSGDGWARWNELLAARSIPVATIAETANLDLGGGASIDLDAEPHDRADDLPTVNVRLRFGSLDLRLLGGARLGDLSPERATIVRLAPELALSLGLRTELAPLGEGAVVLGGRRLAGDDAGLARLSLGGGEIVELLSDGEQTTLRRLRCDPRNQPCSWP